MILVTGGAGYIGSHACVVLAQAGHELLILDNLCNSRIEVVDRLEALCGKRPRFIQGDVRDAALLDRVFTEHAIDAVMHFAGLKAVGESVMQPLAYYDNNVHGTVQLLDAMRRAGISTFVFSSSATVYGDPASNPIREDFPRLTSNPYGRAKLMIEDILADLHRAEPAWHIARLRYFNPVGAHASGLLGEDPRGTPNNLMPFVAQVASGNREYLNVWGNDYPTPDGTGVRDYIHVADLAAGHLAALDYLKRQGGMLTVNLGTGRGFSVLEVVKAFEAASGRTIPCRIAPRRPGDVAQYWADPSLAHQLLQWQAKRDLYTMCADTWRWQSGLGQSRLRPIAFNQSAASP
ncbi:MAG: UDP-glucose 4-epimerase GalE [Betaproteobacteria bacterium]|nr:UDP-glucose 4-epimerase GalE [Betaproteobacteria bacterium]